MKICNVALAISLVGSLVLATASLWAASSDLLEEQRAPHYRTPVEIPITPDKILWVKVDLNLEGYALMSETKAISSGVMGALIELRASKGHDTDLMMINESIRAIDMNLHDRGFTLIIRFRDAFNGIEQVVYSARSYLEAKAIAEDLRRGMIKSLTVYTELREPFLVTDTQSGTASKAPNKKRTWVPCAPSCQLSA